MSSELSIPPWEELRPRPQDFKLLDQFIKKTDEGPLDLHLRALVERSRLWALQGEEALALEGYQQVLDLGRFAQVGPAVYQVARARINRGSSYRRQGFEAQARQEWELALRDYAAVDYGPLQQILVKAQVFRDLALEIPREEILKKLDQGWGSSTLPEVQSELLHQTLQRPMTWDPVPPGVRWLWPALRGSGRKTGDLALGVQAFNLWDLGTRKSFFEVARDLTSEEKKALAGGLASGGLYDWEVQVLEVQGKSGPPPGVEVGQAWETLKAPVQGIRCLALGCEASVVWSDGAGNVGVFPGDRGWTLKFPLRNLFPHPEEPWVLGQYWDSPREVFGANLRSGESFTRTLDFPWVWGDWIPGTQEFALQTEAGEAWALDLQGGIRPLNWPKFPARAGALGPGGRVLRLGPLGGRWDPAGLEFSFTEDRPGLWALDGASGKFLAASDRGGLWFGEPLKKGYDVKSLGSGSEKITHLSLAGDFKAAGGPRSVGYWTPEGTGSIPVEGLQALTWGPQGWPLCWTDSRGRWWRYFQGKQPGQVWEGFQDWPGVVVSGPRFQVCGGLDGLGVLWDPEAPRPHRALGRQVWQDVQWAQSHWVLRGKGVLAWADPQGNLQAWRIHSREITCMGAWGSGVFSSDSGGTSYWGAFGQEPEILAELEVPVQVFLAQDGRIFLGLTDGRVGFCTVKKGKLEIQRFWNAAVHGIQRMAVSQNRLLVDGGSAHLAVWDLDREEPLASWAGGHQKPPRALVPGAQGFFTAGEDGRILSWDLEGAWEILSEERLLAEELAPGARCLTGRGRDKELWLWDLPGTEGLRKLYGSKGLLTCLITDPSGVWAISGARDRSLRFWRLPEGKTQKKIEALEEIPLGLRLSSDGRFLAAWGDQGRFWVWEIHLSPAGTLAFKGES